LYIIPISCIQLLEVVLWLVMLNLLSLPSSWSYPPMPVKLRDLCSTSRWLVLIRVPMPSSISLVSVFRRCQQKIP
jgi:hypothetical protein